MRKAKFLFSLKNQRIQYIFIISDHSSFPIPLTVSRSRLGVGQSGASIKIAGMHLLTFAVHLLLAFVLRGVPMISLVLKNLEKLQVDLAAIDPGCKTKTADAVGDMVVALRDVLAEANRASHHVDDATAQTSLRAAR